MLFLLFVNILKISKISLFWTFWKKNWLRFASWALFILKLYKAFQATVQIAMTSKVMIKFRSKLQFQFFLQFYRTVEEVETCDGNGQKFWQVVPSFQPSHFGYYFCFVLLKSDSKKFLQILRSFFSPPSHFCLQFLFFMIEIQAYWI